jgi:hypothetical protein
VTARDRRAVVGGGAVVLAALLLLRALPWAVRSVTTLRVRVREQQASLTRAEEVLAREPAIHDSLTQVLGRIVALAPRLVDGGTSAQAQAGLASLVSLAASRHQLKVVRLDPLPDSTGGRSPFTRVALHAELEGDIAGLTRLLRDVETSDPLLTVMSLSVLAPAPAVPHTAEALRLELDMAGLYLAREAK